MRINELIFMWCLIHAMISNLAHLFEKIIFLHTKDQKNEEFNERNTQNLLQFLHNFEKKQSFYSIANHDCKIKLMLANKEEKKVNFVDRNKN